MRALWTLGSDFCFSHTACRRLCEVPSPPMSLPAIMKVGCRRCRKITDGRCPVCGTVAYCSTECRQLDAPEHSQSCINRGQVALDANNPVSRYQQTHPEQWATVVALCRLGVDRGFFIVVEDDTDYAGICSWENLKPRLVDEVPAGSPHPIKVSLDTAKADQHNIIVRNAQGGCYHARFAMQNE